MTAKSSRNLRDVFSQNVAANLAAMICVRFGLKMMSQRPGNGLKSFLEVICFNLTDHEPVRSHGEPIHAIFGPEETKCPLV